MRSVTLDVCCTQGWLPINTPMRSLPRTGCIQRPAREQSLGLGGTGSFLEFNFNVFSFLCATKPLLSSKLGAFAHDKKNSIAHHVQKRLLASKRGMFAHEQNQVCSGSNGVRSLSKPRRLVTNATERLFCGLLIKYRSTCACEQSWGCSCLLMSTTMFARDQWMFAQQQDHVVS